MTALDTPGTPGMSSRGRGHVSAPVTRLIPARDGASADSQRVPLLARPMASFYLIASASALLLGLGLVMVLSASSVTSYANSGSSFSIFVKQLMWVGLGIPLLLLAMRMSTRTLRWMAYPLLLVTTLGLMAVLVPGIGITANGARRWLGFGSFTVQPSEVAKIALCLWGADLLVRKRRRLTSWRHLLVPLLPGALLTAGLVMLEPDLGTTLVLLAILMTLLWVVGAPARLFAGLFVVMGVVVSYLAVTEPYRLQRLVSFADPFKDVKDTGWQAVQGLYALASGGWWGVGLGASREKWSYLPNAHTDFILAIIGEELGLLGTLLVIVLFGVLAYGGIRVAQRSADPFGRLAAAAITAWLIGQALINMGAVVGLVPITGIPLPLISFGGSSMLLTMFAIGVLLSLAKTEPAAAQVLAARAASRSAHRTATGRGHRFGRLLRLRRKAGADGGTKSRSAARTARKQAARSAEKAARGSARFGAGRSGQGGRGQAGRGEPSRLREARIGTTGRGGRGARGGQPRDSGARSARGSSRRTRRRQPSR